MANYSLRNNHIERIHIVVTNVDYIFSMANELLKSDQLPLILLTGYTLTDDNEYLESLESSVELIVCTEEQMHKLCIYFDIKKYFGSKKDILSCKH